jgi:hypothetical protein
MEINLTDGTIVSEKFQFTTRDGFEIKGEGGSGSIKAKKLEIDAGEDSGRIVIRTHERDTLSPMIKIGNLFEATTTSNFYLQSPNYIKDTSGFKIDIRNNKIEANSGLKIITSEFNLTGGDNSSIAFGNFLNLSQDKFEIVPTKFTLGPTENQITGTNSSLSINSTNFALTSGKNLEIRSNPSTGQNYLNIGDGKLKLDKDGNLSITPTSFTIGTGDNILSGGTNGINIKSTDFTLVGSEDSSITFNGKFAVNKDGVTINTNSFILTGGQGLEIRSSASGT